MTRTVLLPRDLSQRLDALTNLTEEVNGILLYRRINDDCRVEALRMTGVGTEGHVRASPEQINIANKFFEQNPDYQYVKFHTHSRGTIERHGDHYARNFSQGDILSMRTQFSEDPDFIAMLVTPATKLLCGLDNPQLRILDTLPGYQQRKRAIETAFTRIGGYEAPRFTAHARR